MEESSDAQLPIAHVSFVSKLLFLMHFCSIITITIRHKKS